jgi:transposase-like protein
MEAARYLEVAEITIRRWGKRRAAEVAENRQEYSV